MTCTQQQAEMLNAQFNHLRAVIFAEYHQHRPSNEGVDWHTLYMTARKRPVVHPLPPDHKLSRVVPSKDADTPNRQDSMTLDTIAQVIQDCLVKVSTNRAVNPDKYNALVESTIIDAGIVSPLCKLYLNRVGEYMKKVLLSDLHLDSC